VSFTLLQRCQLLVHDWIYGNRIRVKAGNSIDVAFAERLRMKKIDILIKGSGNSLTVGKGSMVAKCKIRIDGSNQRVEIGEDCLYHAGKIYLRYNSNQCIKIGDKTTIEDAYLLTDEDASITIGRDCMFSKFVHLRAGDGHSVLDVASGKRINRAKDIVIGDHVWVGRATCILKGSVIPDRSVVGAHAVVTRQFGQEGSAIAGNPASVVRSGLDWDRRML
jgi:acetyltransferase-like isoleucine patch superfamily enzyme